MIMTITIIIISISLVSISQEDLVEVFENVNEIIIRISFKSKRIPSICLYIFTCHYGSSTMILLLVAVSVSVIIFSGVVGK